MSNVPSKKIGDELKIEKSDGAVLTLRNRSDVDYRGIQKRVTKTREE